MTPKVTGLGEERCPHSHPARQALAPPPTPGTRVAGGRWEERPSCSCPTALEAALASPAGRGSVPLVPLRSRNPAARPLRDTRAVSRKGRGAQMSHTQALVCESPREGLVLGGCAGVQPSSRGLSQGGGQEGGSAGLTETRALEWCSRSLDSAAGQQ